MNDTSAKQQIAEKIRDSSNILVTVNTNPSVDQLSAALGLTVMLNKMNKHATAVFSGQVPPAIDFLSPGKTFENTVDSLRDFIIALDKEKADHLRYKVEGDVVKIFITPYRTTINQQDLEFSQGDYNVELVLALGVENQENLDQALEAHGRIFHDATVASLSIAGQRSDLGSIDWNDSNASSYSEMLVGLSDSLNNGGKPLLDEQISTAYLTGIVAATDRFSNNLTSSKVMTIAAQLMAAGANQQLIAAKLEEANAISAETPQASEDTNQPNSDGSTDLSEGKTSKVNKNATVKKAAPKNPPKKKKDGAGELTISHEKRGDLDEVARQTAEEEQQKAAEAASQQLAEQTSLPQPTEPVQSPVAQDAEQDLADQLAKVADQTPSPDKPSVADLQKDLAAAASDVSQAAEAAPATNMELPPVPSANETATQVPNQPESFEPSLGGTLNATTEQAAEEKRREEANDRNRTLLSHNGGSYMGDQQPMYNAPFNATVDPASQEQQKPLSDPVSGEVSQPQAAPLQSSAGLTLAQLDTENRSPHEEARSAIDSAYAAQPQPPAPTSVSDAQALFGTAPEPAPATPANVEAPQPLPPIPPLPDFSTLPPLPSAQPSFETPAATPVASSQSLPSDPQSMSSPAPSPTPSGSEAQDPNQFQIPGSRTT